MFGLYELQLPSFLQSKLADEANRFHGGHFAGVFGMGAFSALIVGPCVAPPLAGALLYICQTRRGDAGRRRALFDGARHGRAAARSSGPPAGRCCRGRDPGWNR